MGKTKVKKLFKAEVMPNRFNAGSVYIRARHSKGAVAIAKEYDIEVKRDIKGNYQAFETKDEAVAINDPAPASTSAMQA